MKVLTVEQVKEQFLNREKQKSKGNWTSEQRTRRRLQKVERDKITVIVREVILEFEHEMDLLHDRLD